MTDLVAFLRARLDEDEQHARAATDGPWQARSTEAGWCVDVEPITRGIYVIGPSDAPGVDILHIARHDPARVLRGVEAKRQVLTVHRPGKEVPEWSSAVGRFTTVSCEGCGFGGPCDDPHTEDINECPTLQALATEWSDHPDYRQG